MYDEATTCVCAIAPPIFFSSFLYYSLKLNASRNFYTFFLSLSHMSRMY